MPEENIKTTLQFQADITDFKAAMQEANRAIKLANSEFKAASSGMDDWSNSTDGLSAKLRQLSTVQEAEQRKLDALKASYAQVVKEQGANSAAAQELQVKINNQQAAVNKAAREYNTFADKLDEVENSAGDAADEIKKAGDAAEDSGKSAEEGAGGWTIIKDVIADFVKNTISWAVDSFKELMTAGDNALATLGARTGATAEQMSKYKSVMDDIYRNNYGESFDDVADAMGVVIQTFGELDNASLQNITQKAIALRDTFGFDYQETLRAVNSMMKQFGISADEAYNLIAQGAQNGLNQNGDLLDTINEYSVQFSTAGYSADEMFNMLVNGAESGTWSVDKLGDAVKEFNIRAKDGTVTEALVKYKEQLGLTDEQIQKLSADMEAGGTRGQSAYNTILGALGDVSSETDKYQAGVALFGTMWEDLGAKTIASLMSTQGEISSTKTAMDDLANTKYDTLSGALSGLGRVIQTDLLQPVADTLAPIVKGLIEWVIENMPTLQPIIIGVATAVGILATALAIQGLISGVTKAFALLNATMLANPIVLVVALIAGLVAGIVALWNKSEGFRNFWTNLWNGIKSFFSTIVNWFKEATANIGKFFTDAWNTIKKIWNNSIIGQYFGQVWNTIKGIFSVVKAVLSGDFSGAWEAIKGIFAGWGNFFSGLWGKVTGVFEKVGSWFGNIFSNAWGAITNAFGNVGSFFSDVWSKITGVFSNALSSFGDIGKNLVSGLWNGIKNSFQWIKDKISGWVGNVMDFIKGLFGIHSPSAVMRDEVGKMLGLGMADGIDKSKKTVQRAMRRLRGAVNDDPVTGGGQAGSGLPGGRTVIINQTNNSPRALSRREIYRQTHNALAAAGGV